MSWEDQLGPPVPRIKPMRTRMMRRGETWGLRWIQCGVCGRKFRNSASYVLHFRLKHQGRNKNTKPGRRW